MFLEYRLLIFMLFSQDAEKDGLVFLLPNKKLKIPAITFHQVSKKLNSLRLPDFNVIVRLQHTLSSDQNEALILHVLVLRLWSIYQKLLSKEIVEEGSNGYCQLSELVPLRENQTDQYIEFRPIFGVGLAPYRIEKEYWGIFEKTSNLKLLNCIAIHNMSGAQFADGILLTIPPIFVQSKQERVSRENEISGMQSAIIEKGLVKKEHAKVKAGNVEGHIFILETDAHRRTDEVYEDNEIVITSETRTKVFGGLLGAIKLFSIGRV